MAERTRVLAFSDVDAIMRVLDEPRRPQTIELELELASASALDERRLRDAVERAAKRHPMARARQLPAGPLAPNDRWTILDHLGGDVVEVDAAGADDGAARDRFFSRHIDVTTSPPFRCLLLRKPGSADRFLLSVCHVAFDGVGALRLLRSISRAYTGDDDPVPTVDPEQARRLVESRAKRSAASASARRSPAQLTSSRADGGTTFGILHVDLDADAVRRIGDASINDVLLAGAHLAAASWIRSQGAAPDEIAFMMPVNERPPDWRDDVVANLVQSATITSAARDRLDNGTLLAAIASQTGRIKQDGVVPSVPAIPNRTPIAVRRLLPRLVDLAASSTAVTGVVSNLGVVPDVSWFGSPARGLWFSPPPRRPVVLTIGAVSTPQHLGLSLRWCNDAFSRDDAEGFASMLLESLGRLRNPISSP